MEVDVSKPIRRIGFPNDGCVYFGRLPDDGYHVIGVQQSKRWWVGEYSTDDLQAQFENVPEVRESWINVYAEGCAIWCGHAFKSRANADANGTDYRRVGLLHLTYDGSKLTAEVVQEPSDG